jgi:glycosyltransferase involved in cell wall biosynthesis
MAYGVGVYGVFCGLCGGFCKEISKKFNEMKILFIIPGSGDSFYCGNCFRDNLQADALRKAGHNVIIMPLYLPLRQKSFQADTPLFFPATTYYTEQKFFGKTKMPQWLKRITGSETALKFASSMAGTHTAEGTEAMTLSMITGNDPAFEKNVQAIIDWIRDYEQPDIIHLSSTLLLGIAKMLKQYFDIPIICSVQDEEVWIDSLNKKHAAIAWEAMRENIHYVNKFVTTSNFYRNIIQKRIPQITDIEVIYPCIDSKKYAKENYPTDLTIGFFYRMNYLNGLDILAEAFVILKKRNTIPNLKLRVGGGYSGFDKKFLRGVRKTLSPYKNDVTIDETYNLEEHLTFYEKISVISVPLRFDEAVGLFLCEAFAAGRPAAEPTTGSFPEIVGNAGVLYEPNNAQSLADALEKILINKELYNRSVAEAKNLSINRYNEKTTAQQLETIYNNTKT